MMSSPEFATETSEFYYKGLPEVLFFYTNIMILSLVELFNSEDGLVLYDLRKAELWLASECKT
jgi:hypothetical protein